MVVANEQPSSQIKLSPARKVDEIIDNMEIVRVPIKMREDSQELLLSMQNSKKTILV